MFPCTTCFAQKTLNQQPFHSSFQSLMDEEVVKATEILIAGFEKKSLSIKTSDSIRLVNTPTATSTNHRLSNIVTSKSKNIAAEDSAASSAYNSPLVSPPSSAFVSALQSPYISPRANLPSIINQETVGYSSVVNPKFASPSPTTTLTHPSPSPLDSYCGSQSDDIPSTSYTPPPEKYDFSDDPSNTKRIDFFDDPTSKNTKRFDFCDDPTSKNLKESAPRISFSFPIPRISFAKGSISPASNAKLRSCDVYIGYHGNNPNLTRFCKWLRSELEVQGIACFVADRAKYVDNQSHEIADRVICCVTFGVVVVTSYSLLNHLTLEEIRFFAQKKNLIPVFFDGDVNAVSSIFNRSSVSKELSEALDGLDKCNEYRLEAEEGNWRLCVSKVSSILTSKLGRKSVVEKEVDGVEELPFSRNRYFVGREKELAEIETAFFGNGDCFEQEYNVKVSQSGGLVVVDESFDIGRGKYSSLEVGKGKEQTLEAWVEPANGRNVLKRPKIKKSKSGKYKSFGSSVVCITGLPGIGKTELVLEFACRYSQRYKMVLWVGGEAQYFRQNILNLSSKLGLDVSADTEKERGRIRSFDEQENEAFKRVKRELFRDMPYLLIIDNLESEKEWWEGKDLHDLIPRNTGGTHVIITSRLSKVMNFDPVMLQPLSVSDAIMLMRGRRKKEYPSVEMEFLEKFDEKLGRSSFGLWLIGSLLSELAISPSALFEAINQLPLEEVTDYSYASVADQQLFMTFPFLVKVLKFCAAVLHQTSGSRNLLAMKMFQVGAWFAPSPVSANLLAAAAKYMPAPKNRLGNWTKYVKQTLFCGSGCLTNQAWKTEEDSALLLVKLGLARKTNGQPGCWIQLHHITQVFGKGKDGLVASKSMVKAVRKIGNPRLHRDHLWASAFLVFGFKAEPPLVQLKAMDMVLFTKKTALPLAIEAFTTFSRCNSSLELLKVCTNVLEEVEKSFVTQIQDWCHGSFCWKKALHSHQKVDEYIWQEVTLLKAALLEARAKLLLRGGHFDSGEDLCRTCISIRTVMLGHNHAQTLAAQETLAKLVRMRSKIQH